MTGRPIMAPVVFICACAVLSGCASMRYPSRYKVEGVEFKDFKDIDDDRALKTVALIFNVGHQCREDGVARSIALEEYLKLLAKRNSPYIKSSGILNTAYDKVKLSAWTDDELIDLYDRLVPKANAYYAESAVEVTEAENARRIVYVTAINALLKELKKRDIAQKAMAVAGQVLSAALMVAMAML